MWHVIDTSTYCIICKKNVLTFSYWISVLINWKELCIVGFVWTVQWANLRGCKTEIIKVETRDEYIWNWKHKRGEGDFDLHVTWRWRGFMRKIEKYTVHLKFIEIKIIVFNSVAIILDFRKINCTPECNSPYFQLLHLTPSAAHFAYWIL